MSSIKITESEKKFRNSLGAELDLLRQQKGWSFALVKDKLGVSSNLVRKLFNKEVRGKLDIGLICRTLSLFDNDIKIQIGHTICFIIYSAEGGLLVIQDNKPMLCPLNIRHIALEISAMNTGAGVKIFWGNKEEAEKYAKSCEISMGPLEVKPLTIHL